MLESLIPIHPKVVHFPIALFVTAFLFEMLSLIFKKDALHQAAKAIFVFAALITPLVVRTGMWEVERVHLNHPILDAHKKYALWTMWGSLMSLPLLWFIQKEFKKFFRILFCIVLISLNVFVAFSGHHGGVMVYEYGVGVED